MLLSATTGGRNKEQPKKSFMVLQRLEEEEEDRDHRGMFEAKCKSIDYYLRLSVRNGLRWTSKQAALSSPSLSSAAFSLCYY